MSHFHPYSYKSFVDNTQPPDPPFTTTFPPLPTLSTHSHSTSSAHPSPSSSPPASPPSPPRPAPPHRSPVLPLLLPPPPHRRPPSLSPADRAPLVLPAAHLRAAAVRRARPPPGRVHQGCALPELRQRAGRVHWALRAHPAGAARVPHRLLQGDRARAAGGVQALRPRAAVARGEAALPAHDPRQQGARGGEGGACRHPRALHRAPRQEAPRVRLLRRPQRSRQEAQHRLPPRARAAPQGRAARQGAARALLRRRRGAQPAAEGARQQGAAGPVAPHRAAPLLRHPRPPTVCC